MDVIGRDNVGPRLHMGEEGVLPVGGEALHEEGHRSLCAVPLGYGVGGGLGSTRFDMEMCAHG